MTAAVTATDEPCAARRRPAWQSLDSAQLLLIAVAGMLVIASVTQVGAVGLQDSRTARSCSAR